ncbi:CDP-glycerol:glycerophosphate glycerophosphotransferase [Actinomadura craniellae]|uniref:CDP-glycerol:glycerophosphate glycerophosphotransferase n=1 Tax=Actinomadura craniellae TaxID=2231787 RepID=A0A365H547_9ACTN|nr:bifunctional glycosyltransferase family 2 protein/CDP-glycerol:glycerophosphate glycerophosphotransferase [Actinomadura craniellae]RAY14227.1 CDP-glycerol:glycerophosphate glycerophosphotransferase [Actinomadura craniellae]
MSADTEISLSVIVPVHKVQGYVRQCLESILDPECPNLEVIAVNDCSPDGCGQILDEFAERDPRVRVRHLEQNVGLGEARNIGLDMATGEYVWFFDSDDYATEGAVRSIFHRLAETRPDVLIFDYARGYWHGKVQRSVINDLFREPPAPDVFTLDERPSVLQLMMTAWNKAIRREFLLDLNLRFSGGYYEDINVTYPILMAADRLSLLDRVCYVYRQRRRGAITKTAGAKHFDAFRQYERIFAFMDAQGPKADKFRPLMFDRTIWHLMVILNSRDRLHPDDKRRFFAGLADIYHQYRPAGHAMPEDKSLATKYRLIEKNDYRTYRTLKSVGETRARARTRARKVKKRTRSALSLGNGKAKGLYYRAQRRLPIDENLAVYAAYWYRGYACNPAAIYERARELAPQIRGVWVVKPDAVKSLPPGVEHVVAGSPEYLRLIARAKYFVNNVNYPDDLVKRPGQVHVMTQHGTPLKKMGLDQMDFPVGANNMDFRALITRSDRWNFLLSSNPLSTEAWDRGFPCRYEMLETGYPRNDRLVTATAEDRLRLRAELGVPEGKKAILYAPTHRDYQRGYSPMFDIGRFMRELGPDYVLLLRAHYFYKAEDYTTTGGRASGEVIDVSGHPSVEDLAIASDALLTDYSSIMFDYANLDRPIVIYANDWDTYRRTRGVNFDLMATPPGVVARTEDELVDTFRAGTAWDDPAAKARADFRARFCPWDDGHAAERAVRRIFLGEKVPNPPR